MPSVSDRCLVRPVAKGGAAVVGREILDKCLAEDSAPAFDGCRLLRSLAQVFEELGNSAKRQDRVVTAAVAGGDGQAGLAGMAGLAGDTLQQQRAAGQGVAVMVGIGQPPEASTSCRRVRSGGR